MPLIVETGAIVANADSYVSEADAKAFLTSRGIDASLVVESFLLRAIDMIEALEFKGIPTRVDEQSLSWPRSNVYHRTCQAVGATEIPLAVINAQAWIASYIANGVDPIASPERDVKREKVDVLEVEYSDNTPPSSRGVTLYDMPAAFSLLEPYLASGGGGRSGFLHHA